MSTIHVSAGVLTRGSQILICQRRPDDPHPGKWEFPGGKLQEGEDAAACLWRELQEELSIDATVGPELHSATHTYPNGRTVALSFFHVPSFRGDLVNTQFQALAWVEREQLPTYDFLEGDLEFVAALARGQWEHIFSSASP
jgi:8-oxo-dGTP diphosphatase